VGINGFVGNSHAAAAELHRRSIFVFENRVVLKTELRRRVQNGFALGFGNLSQSANGTKFSLFRKQRAALRASSFGWGCRHRMLFATGILLDFGESGLRKESFDQCGVFESRASGHDSDFVPGNGFVTKGIWTLAGQTREH
jgi:hypothetical protein